MRKMELKPEIIKNAKDKFIIASALSDEIKKYEDALALLDTYAQNLKEVKQYSYFMGLAQQVRVSPNDLEYFFQKGCDLKREEVVEKLESMYLQMHHMINTNVPSSNSENG
jgi:hypothetical protein